jgi:internalin A
MNIMRWILLLLLLLCLTLPLHAQDNPTGYDIALQRIEEAAASGATELFLRRLRLTQLPPEVMQLNNLQVLNLSDNYLTSIPPEIGQLTNLQHLYLTTNHLSHVSPEIGLLTNLQALYLDDNRLTSIPPEIGQLTNLQFMFLNNNELTSLPPDIGRLTNLQVLGLSNNLLLNLPSEMGQLSNLQRLYLYSNQIRHLPPEMGNLTSLTCAECILDLSNNPLISPPPEVVEQGTAAVLAYLRNQAWYHVQRLIIAAASGVGLLAMLLLGVHYRQTRRKSKAKRGEI